MKENKPKKFLDFIITQKCTYKCAYCSQSKQENNNQQNATKETIEGFFALLDKLDKDFEITITGGEAILHPDFFKTIKVVKEKGFKINLISNFSFDIKIYDKIFDTLKNSLSRFDLSFHLDEIADFDSTIDKLELFLQIKPKLTHTTLLVPVFNMSKIKEEKIAKLQNISRKYGVDFDFQNIRVLNKYANKNPNALKTFGRMCYAGNLSAVIYEDGECYRCYSSRFLKTNYIGNIKDSNFKLNKTPSPCVQKICTCPKPNNYNQITFDKKKLYANSLKLINLFYFPFLAIKKKEIIFQKIKQYIKLSKS